MAQFQMPGQLPGQVEGFDANSILMRSQDPEMRALGAKRSASPSDGVVAALAAPQGPTGVAGGYQYVNGKQVGRDPRFALMSPSDTYDALNAKSIDQLVLKNNRPESGPSSGSLVSGKDSPLRAGRPRVIGRY